MSTLKTQDLREIANTKIEVTKGDLCSGLTEKEYNRLHVKGKGAGSKGRAYSHTKLWEAQGRSERIHTFYHKKYDLQT